MPNAQQHHSGDGTKPRLRVTVFSDCICPFCYVGDARLNKLRDGYEQRLRDQSWRGAQIGVQGVPAFLFGRYMVAGAVPAETLFRAAETILSEVSDEEGEA